MLWIAVVVMATLSGVVQAISGFGAGIMMMLVLPHFFDMITSSAIGSAVSIGITATLAWKFRRHMDFKITLLPAVVYMACSLTVLNFIQGMDMKVLTLVFGVFLVALSLYSLVFSKRMKLEANWRTGAVCAAISGICSGLFGIGGPLMAVYFVSAAKDKEAYIGSLQGMFCVTSSVNLLMRITKGIYTLDLLPLTLVGMLCINVGKLLGLRIVDKLNADTFRKVVYAFVGIAGLLTIWQNI